MRVGQIAHCIAEVNLSVVTHHQLLALCDGTGNNTRFACDTAPYMPI
jgi:hypothetical protein